MAGHTPWKVLQDRMNAADPERASRLEAERPARVAALDAEVEEYQRTLAQIRQACAKTQVEVAAALGIGQGEVSKLERRTDLYLSTLGRYVAALGGRLEITAVFGEDTRYPVELTPTAPAEPITEPATVAAA